MESAVIARQIIKDYFYLPFFLLIILWQKVTVPTVPVPQHRAGIFKPLWSPGIDAKTSTPPAYVAWRAGTITLFLVGA
jgi:hypothetical protein